MKFDTIEQLFEFAPPKPLGRAEDLSGKVFGHLSLIQGIVLLVINYNDPIEEILTKKLNDYRTL